MKRLIKKLTVCVLACALTIGALACGTSQNKENATVNEQEKYQGVLEFDHSMELTYATNFSVDYYKGGYKMVKINSNDPILVVPEGMRVPDNLDSDVYVLQQPVSNMLMSSTPTMSLLDSIDSVDTVSLTTTDVSSWYIDNVKKGMEEGKIKYIGAATDPDYELIAATGSKFAVFSAMLNEDVAAKMEQLGVHCVADQSNYESHPLGRVEWVKLYGALLNKEDEAAKVFEKQKAVVDDIASKAVSSDKTVAIFYITSKGDLFARNCDDYVSKMVGLAGGKYIFDGKVGVGKSGTTKMEAEAFYDGAKDADMIIYIWTLGGKPATLDDFLAKNAVLADMKAVKEGNVWCTTPDFFQVSSTIGDMVGDINKAINAGSDVDKLTYLNRLK